MTIAREMTRCPFCREKIDADASRCKHCHADLSSTRKKTGKLVKLNTFRAGFLSGIAFMLVVILLLYLQCN